MEFRNINFLLDLLREACIPVCIVGEIALNYYNAPRIIHDLELCIPAKDLAVAEKTFESKPGLLKKATKLDFDVYTEYKRGAPRFQFLPVRGFFVVLFSDRQCHLEPLPKYLISADAHDSATEYSREILDFLSAEEIIALPLPQFTPFFKGLCRTYVETQEVTAAIAAELLVDGMNIDEKWCQEHFQTFERASLEFA